MGSPKNEAQIEKGTDDRALKIISTEVWVKERKPPRKQLERITSELGVK